MGTGMQNESNASWVLITGWDGSTTNVILGRQRAEVKDGITAKDFFYSGFRWSWDPIRKLAKQVRVEPLPDLMNVHV